MALMLAICRPQPNWMPKNPKLMFQICQNLSCSFCMGGDSQTVRLRRNTEPIHHSRPVEANHFAGGKERKGAVEWGSNGVKETCANAVPPRLQRRSWLAHREIRRCNPQNPALQLPHESHYHRP